MGDFQKGIVGHNEKQARQKSKTGSEYEVPIDQHPNNFHRCQFSAGDERSRAGQEN